MHLAETPLALNQNSLVQVFHYQIRAQSIPSTSSEKLFDLLCDNLDEVKGKGHNSFC